MTANHRTASSSKILVIGCGRMGGAIIKGWLNSGIDAHQVTVIDPNAKALENISGAGSINCYPSIEALANGTIYDIVMLALKPQLIEQFLPAYNSFVNSDSVLISIAAGINSARLKQLLPTVGNIVRVMPNTPALIQQGVIVGYAGPDTSAQQRQQCQRLLEPLGHYHWIDDEQQMDAVTAISGSGPAYLFLFTECLINAGRQLGLSDELAKSLAKGTVSGASQLMSADSRDVEQLRQEVTSPKGTTEAALNVMMEQSKLQTLLQLATAAAAERSLELAGE